MKKQRFFGTAAFAVVMLCAGCSARIETGPVPTVTPRAEEAGRSTATPTPVLTARPEQEGEAAAKRNYKEQYAATGELPSLYETYRDKVLLGVEVLKDELENTTKREMLAKQFGFLSCKNEMNAMYLLDYDATRAAGDLNQAVCDFSNADVLLRYAKENGMAVRGPVLISQNMPDWFFTQDFSEEQVVTEELEDGTTEKTLVLASAEVMLARMENYIKDVMAYCNTNYPGLVVSWDVLSDAINSTDKMEKKYRNSYWYQILGEEYAVQAFAFANADKAEGQKLFYREDGLDDAQSKTAISDIVARIQEGSHVDGFALEIRYTVQSPNVFDLGNILNLAEQTGLELHLMKFCASTITNSREDETRTEEENLEKAAKRYKALMAWLEKVIDEKKYQITCVVFDGMSDDTNEDNQPKEYVDSETGETVVGVKIWNYGYLFDKDLNPKDAFFGALQDESIKAY